MFRKPNRQSLSVISLLRCSHSEMFSHSSSSLWTISQPTNQPGIFCAGQLPIVLSPTGNSLHRSHAFEPCYKATGNHLTRLQMLEHIFLTAGLKNLQGDYVNLKSAARALAPRWSEVIKLQSPSSLETCTQCREGDIEKPAVGTISTPPPPTQCWEDRMGWGVGEGCRVCWGRWSGEEDRG